MDERAKKQEMTNKEQAAKARERNDKKLRKEMKAKANIVTNNIPHSAKHVRYLCGHRRPDGIGQYDFCSATVDQAFD